MNKSNMYKKDTVTSKDGTIIGYRRLGEGPALILVHGGLKSSQDFMKLALILSDAFTVYVPDRRGRGLSGVAGDTFSVMREVEDMQALIVKTGAKNIMGLSSGALVVLRTVLATPTIQRIALYEPPFSVDGSAPTGWVARYAQELSQGRLASALVSGMKGLAVVRIFTLIPRFVLRPMLSIVMALQGESTPDEVTIRALVPTWQYDMKIVDEMSDTLGDYKNLQTRVLLMGGTKSPAWLGISLDNLAGVLSHVDRMMYPGLGHDGPEDDGDPGLVAKDLRKFFTGSSD